MYVIWDKKIYLLHSKVIFFVQTLKCTITLETLNGLQKQNAFKV